MTNREPYPKLTEMLRAMSPEGRELIQIWHATLTAGFKGFAERTPRELGATGFSPAETEAARVALGSWENVMENVSDVIAEVT